MFAQVKAMVYAFVASVATQYYWFSELRTEGVCMCGRAYKEMMATAATRQQAAFLGE